MAAKRKSRFFRVATEGATTDGRPKEATARPLAVLEPTQCHSAPGPSREGAARRGLRAASGSLWAPR